MKEPGTRLPRATISEVAADLGVSKSTVSRAFNRPQVLLPETVTRVRESALRLGYRPSRTARALSTGVQEAIALVVPDIANPFFPRLIRAGQATAAELGLSCLLGDSDETADREWDLVTGFAPDAHGVILMSSRLSPARITELAGLTHLVLINRDVAGLPRVLLDTAPAFSEALDTLYRLGHRRFGYLGGPDRSWSHAERLRAISTFADSHDVTLTVRSATPATMAGGAAAAAAVLDGHPTALLCFDDVVAQGAIGVARRAGLSIPGDLSIVGCDDTLASAVYPPVATIGVDYEQAGRLAVGLLDERLISGSGRPIGERIVLPGHFLPGESIAAPPAG